MAIAEAPAATSAPASAEAKDEPARIDGRVEPTINPAVPAYKNELDRLNLVSAALKLRQDITTKFPPPLTVCRRVPDGSITIDGRLHEDAWRAANMVDRFRDSRTGAPVKLDTHVMLLWDSRYLYIGFACEDTDVVATIDKHDDDLWKEDAAEVFINPTGDEQSYIEVECSPKGVFYDASIAEYRPEVTWDVGSPHLDMDKTIRIFKTHDSPHAAHVTGTLNDSSDTDKGWTCEIAVSWDDLRRGTNVNRPAPRDGDVWRMGLYRINIKSGGNPDEYGAWSPTLTWFHRPWCFGRVLFTDANENPRTKPIESTAAATTTARTAPAEK